MQPPADLSSLLHALAAFLQEHRYCGEPDGGAGDADGLWMERRRGASIWRTPEPAQRP